MAVGIIILIVVVYWLGGDNNCSQYGMLGWIDYVLVVGICYNVTMSVEVLGYFNGVHPQSATNNTQRNLQRPKQYNSIM